MMIFTARFAGRLGETAPAPMRGHDLPEHAGSRRASHHRTGAVPTLGLAIPKGNAPPTEDDGMSVIERAQRILDAARARHGGIATPGWVSSPADTCGTVTLSAAFIASCEPTVVASPLRTGSLAGAPALG